MYTQDKSENIESEKKTKKSKTESVHFNILIKKGFEVFWGEKVNHIFFLSYKLFKNCICDALIKED